MRLASTAPFAVVVNSIGPATGTAVSLVHVTVGVPIGAQVGADAVHTSNAFGATSVAYITAATLPAQRTSLA